MHRRNIGLSLAVALAGIGAQLVAVAPVKACDVSLGGQCEPPPVIVDGGTGPVMADGLLEDITLTVNEVRGVVSGVITDTAGVATPTASSTTPGTDITTGVLTADNGGTGDSHSYGNCYSSDSCTNLQLYEPTYNGYFNPNGDFQADGVAAWSLLVPSDSQPQQFWVWDEHSLLTSKGSNLCILTNSAEISGSNTTIESWDPGGSQFYNSNTTVNFNVGYDGTGVGGSYTLYQGEKLGEVYNNGTGYVASWREQNDNCVGTNDSAELENAVIWAQPFSDAANASFKVETAVWYSN